LDGKYGSRGALKINFRLLHFYLAKHNEGLYHKNPSEAFYEPHVSYFIDSAADRAFSLAEKLAQLVNVYKELNLAEAFKRGQEAVSFKKVVERLDNVDRFKKILAPLESSLHAFDQLRHGHTHRFDPEITRWEVKKVAPGIKNGKDPVTVIMYGINEKALPEPPIKQLEKCLAVQVAFNKALQDILFEIEKDLHP
ncbi:Cthe_2314 family HEPN domain-containing protein, partial [Desulforamulus putei]|uniref:Cthe_2314 family HEPN domain-containing protein n=1 Tax=Desulforamulus putei TaxID=74701 RepID=UPI002FDDAA70